MRNNRLNTFLDYWRSPPRSYSDRIRPSDSAGYGRILPDLVGFSRIQSDLVGFGRIWSDLVGFGRIWSDFDFW